MIGSATLALVIRERKVFGVALAIDREDHCGLVEPGATGVGHLQNNILLARTKDGALGRGDDGCGRLGLLQDTDLQLITIGGIRRRHRRFVVGGVDGVNLDLVNMIGLRPRGIGRRVGCGGPGFGSFIIPRNDLLAVEHDVSFFDCTHFYPPKDLE